MKSNTQAESFVHELYSLYKTKGNKVTLKEVRTLLDQFDQTHEGDKVLQGIQSIAGKINTVKVELASDHPEKITGDMIPDANTELEEIIKATEEATNKILGSAEAIQSAVGSLTGETAEKITAEVMNIFEASTFQDITGQRVRKVLKTFVAIEEIVQNLLNAFSGSSPVKIETKKDKKEEHPDAYLMRGPQSTKDAPSQEEIDKLFSGT